LSDSKRSTRSKTSPEAPKKHPGQRECTFQFAGVSSILVLSKGWWISSAVRPEGAESRVIFLESNRSCERLLPDEGGKEQWLPPKVHYPDEWLQSSFMRS
jgi:hypothetical protein